MDEKTESLLESKPDAGKSQGSDLHDLTYSKSTGSKNKATMTSRKKLVLLISFVLAIGVSFYCLLLSHNAIQAFIPYDEDKVLLEPNDYAHAKSSELGHINFQGYDHIQSAGLSQRMANIEQKLQQVMAQQLSANRLSDREPINLEPVKDQMAAVVQKVAGLEQQLNRMVADQKKVMTVYATFEQLKEAINQGSVFESILNHLYDLIPAGDMRNMLQPLVEYSSVGAASYQQLHEELAVILSKRKSDMVPSNHDNDDWWTRAVGLLKSVIKVHKIDDSPFNQIINLDGAFEKVATLLSKSDVKTSIDILAPFEKNFSTVELNFYNQLMARVTVEDSLTRIDQILLSARFLQTLNTLQ